jgi:hypothetical protein
MLEAMVFNKPGSFSGVERTYWNARGVEAFFATFGLGIGMGSSRASSWLIAVLSQLGVIGAGMLALLVAELLRAVGGPRPAQGENALLVLGASARAAGVAWLVAQAVSGSSADPGLVFFICLATVASCRARLARAAPSALRRPQLAY